MTKIYYLKIVGVCYLFCVYLSIFWRKIPGLFILVLIIGIFTDLGGYVFGKIFVRT